MTEPTDATLQQRCAEILEWQRTGVLTGNALRDYAAQHWPEHHDALQMSERDTSARAIELIAKWGAPPAVAERLEVTAAECEAAVLELEIEDLHTTPQPTQPQAGAVPLTDREIELIDGMIQVQLDHASRCDAIANRAMADKQKGWDMERVALLQKFKAHGIKGGQHGAE